MAQKEPAEVTTKPPPTDPLSIAASIVAETIIDGYLKERQAAREAAARSSKEPENG